MKREAQEASLRAAEQNLRSRVDDYNFALCVHEGFQKELAAAHSLFERYYSPETTKTFFTRPAQDAQRTVRMAQENLRTSANRVEDLAAEVREARDAVRTAYHAFAAYRRFGSQAAGEVSWSKEEEDLAVREEQGRRWAEEVRKQRRRQAEQQSPSKQCEIEPMEWEELRLLEQERKRIRKAAEDQRRKYEQEKVRKAQANNDDGGGAGGHTSTTTSTICGQPMPADVAIYTAWKQSADALFDDYAGMEVFPSPPVCKQCSKPTCAAAKSQRALGACACDIQRAFETLCLVAKDERVKWHPDRFSKCREDLREGFQKRAKEIFQVLNKMHAEGRKG